MFSSHLVLVSRKGAKKLTFTEHQLCAEHHVENLICVILNSKRKERKSEEIDCTFKNHEANRRENQYSNPDRFVLQAWTLPAPGKGCQLHFTHEAPGTPSRAEEQSWDSYLVCRHHANTVRLLETSRWSVCPDSSFGFCWTAHASINASPRVLWPLSFLSDWLLKHTLFNRVVSY